MLKLITILTISIGAANAIVALSFLLRLPDLHWSPACKIRRWNLGGFLAMDLAAMMMMVFGLVKVFFVLAAGAPARSANVAVMFWTVGLVLMLNSWGLVLISGIMADRAEAGDVLAGEAEDRRGCGPDMWSGHSCPP